MKVSGSEPKAQQHEEVSSPDQDVKPEAPKEKGGPTQEAKGASSDRDEFQDDAKPSGPDLQGGRPGGSTQDRNLEVDQANQGVTNPEPRFTIEDARQELEKTEAGRGVLADWDKLKANGGLTVKDEALGGPAGTWSAGERTIAMDPNLPKKLGDYVEVLAHETTHASQSDQLHPERDGVERDPSSFESSKAYADHSVEMEVRAQARAYDVLHEQGITSGYYTEIQKGYDAAVAEGGRDAGVRYLTEQVNAGKLFPGTREDATTWWDKSIAPTKNQQAAG